MALPSKADFATSMMTKGSVPDNAQNRPFFEALAEAIIDAIKAADVNPGTFAVPITGSAGSTALTSGTKGTIT